MASGESYWALSMVQWDRERLIAMKVVFTATTVRYEDVVCRALCLAEWQLAC